MNGRQMNKTFPIQADSIQELSELINQFSLTHEVFSTQIFYVGKGYDCLVHYKVPYETKESVKLASQPQIKLLWKMGWKGNEKTLTAKEAFDLIKEKLG